MQKRRNRLLALGLVCALLLGVSGCGGSAKEVAPEPMAEREAAEKETLSESQSTTEKEEENNMGLEADEIVVISLDNASEFGENGFEGWGSSLCWWGNRVGYSKKLTEEAGRVFFNKEEGLGLNILRYNIGGGDDPTHDHITRTDSNMPGFWKEGSISYDEASGIYNWEYDFTKDENQRNVLLKAYETYGEDFIAEAFSNSPPYFMTNSGCSCGAEIADQDNLRADAYEAFAKYFCDVVKWYEEETPIHFQSVSPMNEPNTNYWGAFSPKQEGCHFDLGDSQSKILVETRKALDERGLNHILLSGTDETSLDMQAMSFNALSEEAKAAVARIDTHTYQGNNRERLKKVALTNGKNLWMSEVDDGSVLGENAGQMGSGLWLSKRIIDDLNGFGCSAWILWQLIDNHICEEGYLGKKDSGMVDVNGGFWGLAVADHDKEEIILTQKYYAMGQFTRYIRPGYVLLTGGKDSVAAYDKENGRVVIVAVNTKGSEKEVGFELASFDEVGESVEVIRTSGSIESGESWASCEPIAATRAGFVANLAPNSVTTFIVSAK